MAFDCVWEEYRRAGKRTSCPRVDRTIAQFDRRFRETNIIVNLATGADFPWPGVSLPDLLRKWPEASILHGSWILPLVREILGEDLFVEEAAPRTPVTLPLGKWVWIRDFRAQGSAWIDHEGFHLPGNGDFLEWKFGLPFPSTIEVRVDTKNRVELCLGQARPSRFARLWKSLRRRTNRSLLSKPVLLRLRRVLSGLFYRLSRSSLNRLDASNWTRVQSIRQGTHSIDLSPFREAAGDIVALRLRNPDKEPAEGAVDFRPSPGDTGEAEIR